MIARIIALAKEKRHEIVRFLKFCVVGTIGTAIDFGLFNLFHNMLGLHEVPSNTLSISAAIVNNYTWSRFWVYPETKDRQGGKKFVQFIVVSLVAWALNTGILWSTDHWLFGETGLFAGMEAQARQNLQAQGVSEAQIIFQRFADMRYKGQEHTVKVPIPAGEIGPAQLPEIDERFHHLHEQAYTFRLETPIELVNYHLSAFGVVDKADLQKLPPAYLTLAADQKGERRVNFD